MAKRRKSKNNFQKNKFPTYQLRNSTSHSSAFSPAISAKKQSKSPESSISKENPHFSANVTLKENLTSTSSTEVAPVRKDLDSEKGWSSGEDFLLGINLNMKEILPNTPDVEPEPGSPNSTFHPTRNVKAQYCIHFVKMEPCPYGKACRFAHSEEELALENIQASYKSKMCDSMRWENCTHKRCIFVHSNDDPMFLALIDQARFKREPEKEICALIRTWELREARLLVCRNPPITDVTASIEPLHNLGRKTLERNTWSTPKAREKIAQLWEELLEPHSDEKPLFLNDFEKKSAELHWPQFNPY